MSKQPTTEIQQVWKLFCQFTRGEGRHFAALCLFDDGSGEVKNPNDNLLFEFHSLDEFEEAMNTYLDTAQGAA